MNPFGSTAFSNSILPSLVLVVNDSSPKNLSPIVIVAVGNEVYPPPLAISLISVMSPLPVKFS